MVQTGPSASILVPDPPPSDRGAHELRRAAMVAFGGYVAMVVVVLAIGLLLTHALDGSIGHWDQSVSRRLAAHRTPTWSRVTAITTWCVNTLPAIGIAAVITGVLALRHRWREAAMLVLALFLELFVFLAVTFVVARPRPDVVRLNDTPSTSSFPSGHTAAATVIFAGLALIVACSTRNNAARALAFAAAIVVPTLVGFARVYRGMHHPTDVVVGAFMGAACLVVAVLAVRASAGQSTRAAGGDDETSSRALSSSAA